MGWRREETKAGIGLTDADSRIDTKDIWEVGQSLAPEVSQPCIVRPELSLQTLPGDQRRPLEITHPVCESDVEVDRQRRGFEKVNGSKVDRYGGTRDFFEEVLTQDDLRTPHCPSRENFSREP